MIDQKQIDAAREALYRIAPEWDQHGDYGTLLVFISEVEAEMKAEQIVTIETPDAGTLYAQRDAERYAIEDAEMCPNCVTPWKCNGPHEFQPPLTAKEE